MAIETRNKTGPLDKSFFEEIVPWGSHQDDYSLTYESRFFENVPQPEGYDPEVEMFPSNLFNLKAWGNTELELEGVRFSLWLSFIPENMKNNLFFIEKKRNLTNLDMLRGIQNVHSKVSWRH